MKLLLIVLFMALFFTPAVLAADVVLKTSHDEYTFYAGEEARIPFIVESTFPRTNVGDLIYTLTRKESQGGLSFTQSNTQSQSFPISPGSSQNAITLASEQPAEYEVSLSLHFRDDGKDYSADLPPLLVHFIEKTTDKTQSGSSSTSPLTSSIREIQPDNPGPVQDPFAEMEEQMNEIRQQNQQFMEQALSSQGMQQASQTSREPRSADQTLQNNQMNAQSSALQKQLKTEVDKNKEKSAQLLEKLQQDPLFIQTREIINKNGYTLSNIDYFPSNEDYGTLSAIFENDNGEKIFVKGNAEGDMLSEVKTIW